MYLLSDSHANCLRRRCLVVDTQVETGKLKPAVKERSVTCSPKHVSFVCTRPEPTTSEQKLNDHSGKLVGLVYKCWQVWACFLSAHVSFANIRTFLELVSAGYLKVGNLRSLCSHPKTIVGKFTLCLTSGMTIIHHSFHIHWPADGDDFWPWMCYMAVIKETKKNRQADRQAGRQARADRQAGRQARAGSDRQTDRN